MITASIIVLSSSVIVYTDSDKPIQLGYSRKQKQVVLCLATSCIGCTHLYNCIKLRDRGNEDGVIITVPCKYVDEATTIATNICNAINSYNKVTPSDTAYITPIVVSSKYAETHDKLAFNIVRIKDYVFIHNYDIKDSDRENKELQHNGFTLKSVGSLESDGNSFLYVRGHRKDLDNMIVNFHATKSQITNYIKRLRDATFAWNEIATDYVNVIDIIV